MRKAIQETMNFIPRALILSRLMIGIVIVSISYRQVGHYKTFAVILLAIGLLTDIFDGIIARRLNISNVNFRRFDSAADQFFFLCIVGATYIQSPAFYQDNWIPLSLLGLAELTTYLVSYGKFRKEVATHALSSKIWTLILFSTLIQLILTNDSTVLFQCCFYTGIITRMEIIAILLILNEWTNDVPSVFHAIRLRQGKTIRRHKLFNG